jgi:hypothetical protein
MILLIEAAFPIPGFVSSDCAGIKLDGMLERVLSVVGINQ